MPTPKIICAGPSDGPAIPTPSAVFDLMDEIETFQNSHTEDLSYCPGVRCATPGCGVKPLRGHAGRGRFARITQRQSPTSPNTDGVPHQNLGSRSAPKVTSVPNRPTVRFVLNRPHGFTCRRILAPNAPPISLCIPGRRFFRAFFWTRETETVGWLNVQT